MQFHRIEKAHSSDEVISNNKQGPNKNPDDVDPLVRYVFVDNLVNQNKVNQGAEERDHYASDRVFLHKSCRKYALLSIVLEA